MPSSLLFSGGLMSRITGKPLTKQGKDNFDAIKWNTQPSTKVTLGKPRRVRGSALTSFERNANEVVYDVLRSDIKKSLKSGDMRVPGSTVFSLTGETARDIMEKRNPQGGD